MSNPTKAAGYIRVSSAAQIEGESLSNQRNKIKQYCKSNNYKFTQIYSDEGISGGSVKERHALLQALHDAESGQFDVLVVNDLSRFGRNARELLENHEELEQHGIKLRSIKEGIDFGSPIGKAMLTMLAAIAELEMNMIKERMYENRIAKAKRGIPTSGRLPFGREFDKETETWSLDPKAKRGINYAAKKYLDGGSLKDISETLTNRYGLPLSYTHLINVLKNYSGNHWEINFKELDEPITYEVPRLLSDHTIQRIKDRLEHNHTNNRADVIHKYVLTGFIRCMKCHRSLSGQTQHHGDKTYKYYKHPKIKGKCYQFSAIPLEKIEDAVFRTIFENMGDKPSFEKAISQNLPDEEYITRLKNKIEAGERDIKNIDRKLDKLVDAVLAGNLKDEVIKPKQDKLLAAKERTVEETTKLKQKLKDLPDIQEIKAEAADIRKDLLRYYESDEHLAEMDFDRKKQLLHWLFDGKASNGDHYGIYVDKKENGEIDYFMFGRLTGLRTIKGNDIDYFPSDDEETTHKNNHYKTNNTTANKENEQDHPGY